ncbi:hypothetical protein ACLKA7_015383 [Drosophila subpalustris]
MKALSRSRIVVFLLAVCVFQPLEALRGHEDLCRLFKSGTLIRKPGTCDQYIECLNDEGTLRKCATDMVFDPSTKKCVAATATNSVHCGNLCEGLDQIFVADPTDCQYYFYCEKGESKSGHCPGSQHFDEATQSCQYGVDSLCVDVANICELLPDKTKFKQETDCNEYFECKSGKHSLKSCSSSQYFNVETGTCLAKNKVQCNAHSKKKVCVKTTALGGSSPITGYVSDGATCRGYFYCANKGIVEDLDPVWNQCPEHFFFDTVLKKCAEATSVVCTNNRCDGRGTMLVTSSSNNCHNYIRCENGIEMGESTCHWDYFFDEATQGCVSHIIYDACCDGRD